MSEIKTPLLRLVEGETFTADEDGALVITEAHTHADILRYIVGDIGADDVRAMLDLDMLGAPDGTVRKRH